MATQQPIGSPFNAFSTAAEVLARTDLSGQTALVTGGYSGLGTETTRALASAGANVIVPARDKTKAEKALAGIQSVEIYPMDLNDPGSIRAFAGDFVGSGRSLKILINSAGVMATPLHRDLAGHEGQFSTNHLGHFRLTCALWPALVRAGGARVISLSSRGHQISDIDYSDIDFERRTYDKWIAYGQSKTANALFALALDERGKDFAVRAFSLHPGQILTDLARHLTSEEIDAFGVHDADGKQRIDPARGLKTVEQGAATSVWAATTTLLNGMGGSYCEDCDVAVLNSGDVGRRGVARWATDPESAERLWKLSASRTGMDLER